MVIIMFFIIQLMISISLVLTSNTSSHSISDELKTCLAGNQPNLKPKVSQRVLRSLYHSAQHGYRILEHSNDSIAMPAATKDKRIKRSTAFRRVNIQLLLVDAGIAECDALLANQLFIFQFNKMLKECVKADIHIIRLSSRHYKFSENPFSKEITVPYVTNLKLYPFSSNFSFFVGRSVEWTGSFRQVLANYIESLPKNDNETVAYTTNSDEICLPEEIMVFINDKISNKVNECMLTEIFQLLIDEQVCKAKIGDAEKEYNVNAVGLEAPNSPLIMILRNDAADEMERIFSITGENHSYKITFIFFGAKQPIY